MVGYRVLGDVSTMMMGFVQRRRGKYGLTMQGDPLTLERGDK